MLEMCCCPVHFNLAKLKPIVIWTNAFSRASCRSHVFTLSFDWLLVTFTFVLIGLCDYFGFGFVFGFTTLNRKAYEGGAQHFVILFVGANKKNSNSV